MVLARVYFDSRDHPLRSPSAVEKTAGPLRRSNGNRLTQIRKRILPLTLSTTVSQEPDCNVSGVLRPTFNTFVNPELTRCSRLAGVGLAPSKIDFANIRGENERVIIYDLTVRFFRLCRRLEFRKCGERDYVGPATGTHRNRPATLP